jgi:hypothetical protein
MVMVFTQGTLSQEKSVLANGEVSKISLSGVDLPSEYPSHLLPAFLATPLGQLPGSLTSIQLNQPCIPHHHHPAAPAAPGSTSQKMILLYVQRNAGVILTPSPLLINSFTSWVLPQHIPYSPTQYHLPATLNYHSLVPGLFLRTLGGLPVPILISLQLVSTLE